MITSGARTNLGELLAPQLLQALLNMLRSFAVLMSGSCSAKVREAHLAARLLQALLQHAGCTLQRPRLVLRFTTLHIHMHCHDGEDTVCAIQSPRLAPRRSQALLNGLKAAQSLQSTPQSTAAAHLAQLQGFQALCDVILRT